MKEWQTKCRWSGAVLKRIRESDLMDDEDQVPLSSKAIDGFENHLDHGKKQAHKDCDDPQYDD